MNERLRRAGEANPLYVNDSTEAQKARTVLERFCIDIDVCPTRDRHISLSWNGITYRDLFGVLDFLMFAGRLPIPGLRKGDRLGDGRPPGSPISLV